MTRTRPLTFLALGALFLLPGAAHAFGKRAVPIENVLRTKANEKVEFAGAGSYSAHASYITEHPEIFKTTQKKKSTVVQVFRIEDAGFKEVRRIKHHDSGRITIASVATNRPGLTKVIGKLKLERGKVRGTYKYGGGLTNEFEYDVKSGEVAINGDYSTMIRSGLSPARALSEYLNNPGEGD